VVVSRLKQASERLAGHFGGWEKQQPEPDTAALEAMAPMGKVQ
jgi:hypothetical protein